MTEANTKGSVQQQQPHATGKTATGIDEIQVLNSNDNAAAVNELMNEDREYQSFAIDS